MRERLRKRGWGNKAGGREDVLPGICVWHGAVGGKWGGDGAYVGQDGGYPRQEEARSKRGKNEDDEV